MLEEKRDSWLRIGYPEHPVVILSKVCEQDDFKAWARAMGSYFTRDELGGALAVFYHPHLGDEAHEAVKDFWYDLILRWPVSGHEAEDRFGITVPSVLGEFCRTAGLKPMMEEEDGEVPRSFIERYR